MTLPSAPGPARPLILIVEDHSLIAKFYRMALERAGTFRTHLTEDAAEAMALAESGKVALALLDVSLRDTYWEGRPIDGIELSRLIKQRAPSHLPVLLATAHAMAGERERIMEKSGADDCLEKPIYDAQLLVATIHRLLRS